MILRRYGLYRLERVIRSVSVRVKVVLGFAVAAGVAGATVLLLNPPMETASAAQQSPAGDTTIRFVPADLRDTPWLERFRDAQVKAAAGVSAFHDFQFTDELSRSGISFRHRIVDDAGKTYKAAHYDHGNGVAIADVDGDGLSDIYFVSQVGGNELWKNVGGGDSRTSRHRPASRWQARSACPPRLPTSTTMVTRISTSPPSAPAISSSRTTAAADSATSRRPLALATWAIRRAPCSSTTTATAGSTCSWSTSGATRRTRSRVTATSTTWRSRTPSPAT